MTGLMTNRTDDRLASMEDTNRKISHGHGRRNSFTEGHHKTTSTIGHRREITKETRTHGVNNTKTLEHGLHIVVGDFEWKIANEDETDILVSSGNRNRDVPEEESRSSRYSAVLKVTRTRPLLRNCTASIISASRALSNCGATAEIPRFLWISCGKCNTTLLPKAISAKLIVQRFNTFHTTCLKSVR